MAYEKTTWVNGETPAGATNMNKIENELEALDTGKADQTDLAALSTTVSGHTTAIAGKQDKLTAGDNITIENNIISASGGSAQTDYTTGVEIQIGTWDNKPLYRKVINIGSITNTSNNNIVNPNIDNLDTLINLDGMFKVSDSIIPINFHNSVTASGSYSFCCFYSNNNLYILCKTAINSGFVIMEYTKTTD